MRGMNTLLVAGSLALAGLVVWFVVRSHRINAPGPVVAVSVPAAAAPATVPAPGGVRYAAMTAQQVADRPRWRLASNQRCIGGMVITVEGSVYTQEVRAGVPVRCVGREASHPLR